MTNVPSWSFTAVQEFLQCPKKYHLNRVLKVLPFQETDAMRQGNIIHKHFEDRLRHGTKFPEHMTIYEPFIQNIENRVVRGEWLEIGAETEVVFDRDLKLIGAWGQVSPRPWFSKQAWYRGKFDIVALLDPKRALILDVKTGKRKPDNPQLELFAAVAFKALPELEKVTTGYLWTKANGAIDKQVFFREAPADPAEGVSPKGEKEIWTEWLGHVHRIDKAYETNNWPCRPSPLCGWCDATPTQCPNSKK